jgi:WD40 repeat protein
MIKQFLVLLFSVVMCFQAMSQHDYETAIKQAGDSVTGKRYSGAIKLYNAAKAFDPSESDMVDMKIDTVFNLIDSLRLDAINQKNRAEFLRKEAEKNLDSANKQKLIANNALKISRANEIMYEAQGVVKLDPTLALHLADTALDIIDTIKNIKRDHPLIFDKANRIYYENNFGETLISYTAKQDSLGKFIRVAYGPEGKSIWTITDKLRLIKWNLNGEMDTSIALDAAYKNYTFKLFDKDRMLVVYGIDEGAGILREAGIKSWMITNHGFTVLEDSCRVKDSAVNAKKDSIVLNPQRDTSEGWTKRLLVFGHRAFQIKDGKLISVVRGVSNNISVIAFSPNGKLVATNGASRSKTGINVFNMQGATLDSNSNIGDSPESFEFFSNDKMVLAKCGNSLQVFQITNNGSIVNKYNAQFFSLGLHLNSYELSCDEKWVLTSAATVAGKQQVIQFWQNDNGYLNLYAQFKSLGSVQTSAVFENDSNIILTSPNSIIKWSRPAKISEPFKVINSDFFTSIDYTEGEHFTATTYTNKKIRYTVAGNDSTIINDSSKQARLSAFMLDGKVVIASEDGELQIYLSKEPLDVDEFRKAFLFDPFTDEQKKRYGIENK